MKTVKRMLLITLITRGQYATAMDTNEQPKPSLEHLSALIKQCDQVNQPPLSNNEILDIQEKMRALFQNPAKAVLTSNKEDLDRVYKEIARLHVPLVEPELKSTTENAHAKKIMQNMEKVVCGPLWHIQLEDLLHLQNLIGGRQVAERQSVTDLRNQIRMTEESLSNVTISQSKMPDSIDKSVIPKHKYKLEIFYHFLIQRQKEQEEKE